MPSEIKIPDSNNPMQDNTKTYLLMAEHYESAQNPEKAREFYEKALALGPSARAHERLGIIFKKSDMIEEARDHFVQALSINPSSVTSIYNMAIIDRLDGDYESSMKKYTMLKEMGVKDPSLSMSMGVLHSETGNIDEALAHYRDSFEKMPENEMLKFNYSLCLMTLGDFERGLELYESRIWNAKPPGNEWAGEKDADILVVPEQGNGDIIHFARFVPFLKPMKRCEKVTVLCNRPLVELMRTLDGVDEVMEFNPGDEFVAEEEGSSELQTVPFGKFIRIMSIPRILDINPSKIPFKKYISADPEKVKKWKSRMDSKKIKVGLCWQGGVRDKPEMVAIDKRRSMPLETMLPILACESAEFYSLQKDDNQHERFPQVRDFMGESEDFTDTAAIIENLDLVITVDTAVAHLAAALEKPTWMMSRKGGCWRWGVEGESTFWYPSMRIFRQEKINDWGPVVQRVSDELKKFAQSKSRTPSV